MNGQEMMDYENRVEEIKEEIHERFPDIDWPEPVLEPIYFGRLKKVEVPERKVIMDVKTKKVWDIVSDNYAMIPHEKALYDILSNIPEEMGHVDVKFQLWAEGARFKADLLFPEIERAVPIKVGDIVVPRMSVKSSYDRSLLHGVEFGGEQLVCTNGLVMFKANQKLKRKHIAGSHVTPEIIAKLAENFIEEYSISTEQWKKWANTQLSNTQVREVIEELPFSDPEKERILNLPLMNNENKNLIGLEKPTLWDINSAATQFAKHEVRGENRSISLEESIAQAMDSIEKGL